jgi:putative transcriptional regulator
MTKAFDKISEGLNEVLAIARGEASPAKIHFPQDVNVREIRSGLRLSQEEFATTYGFTINQIRDWEQGRSQPIGGVRAYLLVIQRAPEQVASLLPRGAAAHSHVRRVKRSIQRKTA